MGVEGVCEESSRPLFSPSFSSPVDKPTSLNLAEAWLPLWLYFLSAGIVGLGTDFGLSERAQAFHTQ